MRWPLRLAQEPSGPGPQSVSPDPCSRALHLLRSTRDHRGVFAPPRPFPVPPLSPSPPRGPPPPASHDGSEENPQGKRPEVGCGFGSLGEPAEQAAACTSRRRLRWAGGLPRTQLLLKAPPGGLQHPTPSDGACGGPGAQPAFRPEVPWSTQRSFPASFLGPAWYGVPGPLPDLGLLR